MSPAKMLVAYLNFYRLLLVLVLVLVLLLLLLRAVLQRQKKRDELKKRARASTKLMKRSNVVPPQSPPQGEFEKILDFVLRYVSRSLATHCVDIAVPNIQQSFPVKWGIFQLQCNLSAKRGNVGDISSLFRDGPARVHEVRDEELILDAAVGLRYIQLRYNDYSLSSRIFSISGHLQVNAAPVSLRMGVLLRPPFVPELQSLRVENLGPVKLEITGLGLFGSMLPYAEKWINKNAFAYIQDIALQHISHAVNDTLQSFSRKMETIPQLMVNSHNASVGAPPQQIAIEDSIEQYKRKIKVEIVRRHGIGGSPLQNTNAFNGYISNAFDSCIPNVFDSCIPNVSNNGILHAPRRRRTDTFQSCCLK